MPARVGEYIRDDISRANRAINRPVDMTHTALMLHFARLVADDFSKLDANSRDKYSYVRAKY